MPTLRDAPVTYGAMMRLVDVDVRMSAWWQMLERKNPSTFCDANTWTHAKWTASHPLAAVSMVHACRNGDASLVKLLLDADNLAWLTGLCVACSHGHLAVVALITYPFDNRWAENWIIWGQALNFACSGGHREIVEHLIARGATNWNEGLHGACLGRQRELAEFMIQCGATKRADALSLWPDIESTAMGESGI